MASTTINKILNEEGIVLEQSVMPHVVLVNDIEGLKIPNSTMTKVENKEEKEILKEEESIIENESTIKNIEQKIQLPEDEEKMTMPTEEPFTNLENNKVTEATFSNNDVLSDVAYTNIDKKEEIEPEVKETSNLNSEVKEEKVVEFANLGVNNMDTDTMHTDVSNFQKNIEKIKNDSAITNEILEPQKEENISLIKDDSSIQKPLEDRFDFYNAPNLKEEKDEELKIIKENVAPLDTKQDLVIEEKEIEDEAIDQMYSKLDNIINEATNLKETIRKYKEEKDRIAKNYEQTLEKKSTEMKEVKDVLEKTKEAFNSQNSQTSTPINNEFNVTSDKGYSRTLSKIPSSYENKPNNLLEDVGNTNIDNTKIVA